ncbi:MAG: hypothetical protein AB1730_22610 [Myxococcota bacterium]|jgi:hypothetical protein
MTVRLSPAALSRIAPTVVKPHTSPLSNLATAIQDAFGGTHSSYKARLRNMNDQQLAAEARRLQAVIADASSGPNRNPSVAARARAQLGEVREEQKTRADFAKSPNPAYARDVHHMSDAQLSQERAKQLERYHEATTGYDKDPAKAADAKAKLEILGQESIGRFKDALQGALPRAVPTRPMNVLEQIGFSLKASKMTDAQLRHEKAKALGELRDATTGAHRDPVAAANAQKKLDILNHIERSRHPHTRPISNQELAAFQKHASQRSSGQLKADIERTKAELKKLGNSDPVAASNAMRKLGVLEGALRKREDELYQLGKWAAGASDADLAKYAQDCRKHLNRSSPDFAKTLENLNVITAEQHKRAEKPAPVEPRPAEMSLDDLVGDLLKNLERYHEATTGFDRDPAKAQDAMGHIRADVGELLKRVFEEALKAAF